MRRCLVAVLVLGAALALIPTAAADHGHDLDCSDFSSQASAQYHMNAHPGDPDGLDGNDQDGRACESNPGPYYYGTAAGPEEPTPSPTPAPVEPTPVQTRARVTSVIDGDTIKVRLRSGARRTVRVIGIDTPESVKPDTPVECGAKAASKAMRKLAMRKRKVKGKRKRKTVGETVRLTSDPTQDATDAYGRMLAYVTRARDGKDIGEALLRSGWAMVYVYDDEPFQRVERYTAAEQRASDRGAGVWGRCDGDFHSAS